MRVTISLFVLICLIVKSHSLTIENDEEYGVSLDGNLMMISAGCDDQSLACGVLESTASSTGWNTFHLTSSSSTTDELQAEASGFLEGAMTQSLIWSSWQSFANGTTFTPDPRLQAFVSDNDKWVRSMVQSPPVTEKIYWAHVGLVLAQFDGMLLGYNTYATQDQALTSLDFLFYQLTWEIGDIMTAIDLRRPTDTKSDRKYSVPFGEHSLFLEPIGSHCSVLIKATDDGTQLLSSHDTWSTFSAMLRVYKHYDQPFSTTPTAASGASFSSFPGNLVSGDDWYITSQNLIVIETTNDVMDTYLYANTTEQTVMYWIRVMVANRMSSSGQQWSNIFALYNSGTYNNQWIIVDNKLFTPGQPLQPNTLWIAEQIPGYVVSGDQTDVLISTGYWASYNIPFYPFIYNISGYPAYFSRYGNEYSYSHCARANIFRRDQNQVHDMPTFKRMMRYNQWQTDTLSLQDACRGISARCDLNAPWAENTLNTYSAFGGIDCKVTNNLMSESRTCEAVSGPTWDSQAPFAWTSQWPHVPHYGQPQVFDFDFVTMTPIFQ